MEGLEDGRALYDSDYHNTAVGGVQRWLESPASGVNASAYAAMNEYACTAGSPRLPPSELPALELPAMLPIRRA